MEIFGEKDEGGHITAGSRSEDGKVPNLNFNPDNGKVNLNNVNPENRNPNIGVRRVVSSDFADSESSRPTFCLPPAKFLQTVNIFYRTQVSFHLRLLAGPLEVQVLYRRFLGKAFFRFWRNLWRKSHFRGWFGRCFPIFRHTNIGLV